MSYNDKFLLSTEPTFVSRVHMSMIAAAIAISNESSAATFHVQRDGLAVMALAAPGAWATNFSATVATDATVIGLATNAGATVLTAGNLAAQAALVTDAAIDNAVSAQWNSFFGH